MLVHINTIQNEQLNALVHLTGIEKEILLAEALGLFLARWEYVLSQDPYLLSSEVLHYNKIVPQNCTLEIDVTQAPGNAISYFLIERLSLNAISLSYVTRKALALLFEGKPLDKKQHI